MRTPHLKLWGNAMKNNDFIIQHDKPGFIESLCEIIACGLFLLAIVAAFCAVEFYHLPLAPAV
jgi:hypothetical protein